MSTTVAGYGIVVPFKLSADHVGISKIDRQKLNEALQDRDIFCVYPNEEGTMIIYDIMADRPLRVREEAVYSPMVFPDRRKSPATQGVLGQLKGFLERIPTQEGEPNWFDSLNVDGVRWFFNVYDTGGESSMQSMRLNEMHMLPGVW